MPLMKNTARRWLVTEEFYLKRTKSFLWLRDELAYVYLIYMLEHNYLAFQYPFRFFSAERYNDCDCF